MTAHELVSDVGVMHPENVAPFAMPAMSEDGWWLGS
jgi:hypothetical protein